MSDAMNPTRIATLVLVACSLLLCSCGEDKKKRGFTFFPNMHDQPSLKAFEPEPGVEGTERGMRDPVAGTMSSDYSPYLYAKGATNAAELANPLSKDIEVLKAGRRAFNIYCIVCHGPEGSGDGNIIGSMDDPAFSNAGHKFKFEGRMPPPPPLYGARIRGWSDGQLFNYLTHGGSLMPSYGHLPPEMRWSIVHYVRVLDKAKNPTEEEYQAYEAVKDQFADPAPSEIVNNWRKQNP